MLGHVELRSAQLWIEVLPSVKNIQLHYFKKGEPAKIKKINYRGELGKEFNPVKFEMGGLDFNSIYQYHFLIDGKQTAAGSFTTQDLWQWRKPAPDFSFIAGSCAYFNDPKFDRPGKPYGADSTIYQTMAKEKAAFMLWVGDNWYYRESDFFSIWGLWYRAQRDRSLPVLQPLLKAMPHYAIWDDHDYGPNDSDKSYVLKNSSREIFKSYWCNPSFGMDDEATYSMMTYSDADFFLLDDRWYRSNNDMDGKSSDVVNNNKKMFGDKQMEWLRNALLGSTATFKFIVTGSQALNTISRADCLPDYPAEFNALMEFLATEKIDGVVFLTGDRHHSEVIKYERPSSYTLYDITNSPLTSGISKVTGTAEANNPARVPNTLVEKHNYSRISINGPKNNRQLKVEFIDINGNVISSWYVNETELKNRKD